MIEINNLSFKYDDEYILNEISLVIEDGDYILVHGENGSGKSTLIKCLLGINKVGNGVIKIDGVDINSFNEFTTIGYIEQFKKNSQDISITAMEYFKMITKDKDKINKVVKDMKIEDLVNKDMSTMSGGQRQKVVITKTLLFDINYLILDEPNTGLDFKSRKELYELLEKLNNSGITIIIISHHMDEISCSINKMFEMKENQLIMKPKEDCEYCRDAEL